MSASRAAVKHMADRLIATLSSSMDSDRADAIVRDVAEDLYRDVLGIPGKIVVDQSKPTGLAHYGGGRGVKKGVMRIADYKFQPDEMKLPDDRKAL